MPSHVLAQSCIHKPGHRCTEARFLSDCSSIAGLLRHCLCKLLIAYGKKAKCLAWSDLFLPLHTHIHTHTHTHTEFIQTSPSTPTAFPHLPIAHALPLLSHLSLQLLLVSPSQKLTLPSLNTHGIVLTLTWAQTHFNLCQTDLPFVS